MTRIPYPSHCDIPPSVGSIYRAEPKTYECEYCGEVMDERGFTPPAPYADKNDGLCDVCYDKHYCECGQRLEDSYGQPGDGFCVRCR